MKHEISFLKSGCVAIGLCLFAMAFIWSGCTDNRWTGSDECIVVVCNYDDHEYEVHLNRALDDVKVDDFRLGEFYDLFDYCEQFDDVDPGAYYLTIYEDGDNSQVTDRSNTFYLNEGEFEEFWINEDGNIKGDEDSGVEGSVTVCNFDDNEYEVRLYSASSNTLVESFRLGEYYDLADHCETFEDVQRGEYYIAIYEDGQDFTDQSDNFYLEDNEYLSFWIDDTGDIDRN